ncbi:MAG: FtsL-like putative cell division protein [Nonlabens sp.]
MATRVYDFLKGSFLTNDDAFKNWRFILFAASLAMVMIFTGHSFEKKVHRMARLTDKVNELRSEYMDGQRQLMFLEMESQVAQNLKGTGLGPAEHPPLKIIVKSDKKQQ